jgi:putative ABC transport system permease protein
LLTRSLFHLQETSTGFKSDGLLVADAPLSPGAYDTTAKRNAFVERLLDRLRTTPGVQAAAVATAPPFSGGGSTIHFNITGRPPKGPEEYILTGLRAVTTDYFAALGVPLVAGRGLTDRDRDQSPPVAIVNETFAKRYFSNQAQRAVGARAQLGTVPDDDSPRMEIVGIVGDTKQAFEADIQPTMYVPYLQPPIDVLAGLYRNLSILLKTSGNPAALAGSLRQAVSEVDRDQPLARVRTMEDAMADSVMQPRLRTILLALLSAIALILSLIGVYGVMAYSVSERTHEIGVRIALGASPAEIRALIMSEGTRLAAVGIAIGVAGALAMSRALSALLFGISATDPITFVVAAASLALAALAAAYAPARRAGRIDPVVLLR